MLKGFAGSKEHKPSKSTARRDNRDGRMQIREHARLHWRPDRFRGGLIRVRLELGGVFEGGKKKVLNVNVQGRTIYGIEGRWSSAGAVMGRCKVRKDKEHDSAYIDSA